MTDERIEKALHICGFEDSDSCNSCPIDGKIKDDCRCGSFLARNALDYINRLKSAKQLAKTQLKELLSALYKRTGEESVDGFTEHKGFTLYRKDIVELAKDYGIKEEELK